jgi:pyruvate-formate lyase
MVSENSFLLSDRVKSSRASLFDNTPRLSTHRLKCMKAVYKETEGQPTILRRARLFEKVLTEIPIFIDENPIVGAMTEYRLGVPAFPEVSCKWMKGEKEYSSSLGTVQIEEEDRKILAELADEWEDKCILARTKELWNSKYSGILDRDECVEHGVFLDQTSVPRGRTCVDYAKVMNIGLEGIIAEARAELEKLPLPNREALNKRFFLDAVIISCNAVITYAGRYAALAREMAEVEPNAGRKEELGRIAEVCSRVPAKPARGFHEAIQAFWFTHLSCLQERNGSGYSPGRFALYTYPF